jgi:hypothetical protein
MSGVPRDDRVSVVFPMRRSVVLDTADVRGLAEFCRQVLSSCRRRVGWGGKGYWRRWSVGRMPCTRLKATLRA